MMLRAAALTLGLTLAAPLALPGVAAQGVAEQATTAAAELRTASCAVSFAPAVRLATVSVMV
jgi:hypothetical protein